jgi:glycosyl hydrolase family 11/predicted xylan-binding protein with Ca-dependent carbohydrate-binding module
MMNKPRLMKTCLAWALLALGAQQAGAQETCLSANTNQYSGTQGGYRYELWNPQGAANPTDECITLKTGATFSGRWTNADDYLARRGLNWGSSGQDWRTRGAIKMVYSVDWQPKYVDGGNSSIGVYGWVHPANNKGTLAEFYIIENWYQWNHSQDGTAVSMGTVAVNGVVYEVIRTTRKGQPTPWGNADFYQYVSVRKDRGNSNSSPSPAGTISGTISVGQHFAAWEKFGLDMSGELFEVTFLAEGYKSTGTVNVTQLDISTVAAPTSVKPDLSSYDVTIAPDGGNIVGWSCLPDTYNCNDVSVVLTSNGGSSFCKNATVAVSSYHGRWPIYGLANGSCTLHMISPDGSKSGTATINSAAAMALPRILEYRALGNKGGEQIYLTRDGNRFQSRTLTTAFQTFTDTVYGEGEIGIEFVNDDAVANGKAVRVDYLSVNGLKRETEAQAVNTGSYANGNCGGGAYSEWLYCAGKVSYGSLNQNHQITVRARGNAGGEHIALLINGQAVNGGWTLSTAFQEFNYTVVGDGDINVRYDNDGGSKDVVVDWVRVDSQTPRQAENMQYNTGAFANGRCGGGSYSEWLHCNGVIGFGKVSDNFN